MHPADSSSGRKISKWGFFESAEGTLEKRLKKNSNYPLNSCAVMALEMIFSCIPEEVPISTSP